MPRDGSDVRRAAKIGPGRGRGGGAGREVSLIDKLLRLVLHASTDEATREVARLKLLRLSGADAERRLPAVGAVVAGTGGEGRAYAKPALGLDHRTRHRSIRHWAAAPESQVLDVLA
jgi:hypothetical protein